MKGGANMNEYRFIAKVSNMDDVSGETFRFIERTIRDDVEQVAWVRFALWVFRNIEENETVDQIKVIDTI